MNSKASVILKSTIKHLEIFVTYFLEPLTVNACFIMHFLAKSNLIVEFDIILQIVSMKSVLNPQFQ